MGFNITIQGVEEVQKNGYKFVRVAYDYKGKQSEKDLATFGAAKDVAKIMKNASEGDVFSIETAENGKGYKDWVKATNINDSNVEESVAPNGNSRASRKGTSADTYSRETPEERAKRQLSIVRQSSLSTAVEILKVRGVAFGEPEVIQMAETLVKWVYSDPTATLGDE